MTFIDAVSFFFVLPLISPAVYWDLAVGKVGSERLHKTSGELHPGRFLGVLGPSGCGKSTFLSAVAGSNPDARGFVTVDGRPLSLASGNVAFLAQEDRFFSMLTVRETLAFAAAFQLPGLSSKEREAEVQACEARMGLAHVSERRVGNPQQGVSGISGGERRRLAVGCELLRSPMPSLLVADEPTSGLDAYQAKRVVELLRQLARNHSMAVVASLHQPRSSIFFMLDDILLLAPGGHVAYLGASREACAHFGRLGHPCPDQTNPAEHLLDIVSIDPEDEEQGLKDKERIASLIAAAPVVQNSSKSHVASKLPRHLTRPTVPCRFSLLLARAWKQQIRNRALNAFRFSLACGLATALGAVFGNGAPSREDRASILLFSAINTAMNAQITTLDRIGAERPVVWRERARSQYGAAEFIISKLVAELPVDAAFAAAFAVVLSTRNAISTPMHELAGLLALEAAAASTAGLTLGAIAPDPQAALALGTAVSLLQMLPAVSMRPGAGSKSLPLLLEPVAQTSSVKWAAEALLQTEFHDDSKVLKLLNVHGGAGKLLQLIVAEAIAAIAALQLQSGSPTFATTSHSMFSILGARQSLNAKRHDGIIDPLKGSRLSCLHVAPVGMCGLIVVMFKRVCMHRRCNA